MLLPIVLVLLGLGFVIAEVFFVSFGLLSLVAGCLIIGADVLAFEHGNLFGWVMVVGQIILIPLIVKGAFVVLPRLPFGRHMMLDGPVTEPDGGFPSLEHLRGLQGRSLSALRPSGTAEIGGERVSVVAVGRMVAADEEVRVVEVTGNEVRVKALHVAAIEDEIL